MTIYPVCFPVSTEAPEPFRDGFLETLRQASTTSKLSRPLSRRAGAITTAHYTATIVAPPDNDTLQSQQVGNNLEAGRAIIARSVVFNVVYSETCFRQIPRSELQTEVRKKWSRVASCAGRARKEE